MRKAYVRESKLHPMVEQEAILREAGFTDWSSDAPVYIDAKPKRGDAGWEWRRYAIRSCRPGCDDEIWVAWAGVWASSTSDALEALRDLTERGAVLVVASTDQRYSFHPDAAAGLELAAAITREHARLASRKASEARRIKNEAERKAEAQKWRDAWKLWLNNEDMTAEQIAKQMGVSRSFLIRKFGPRGTPRFGKKRT